jgi:HlyD family secretion protein
MRYTSRDYDDTDTIMNRLRLVPFVGLAAIITLTACRGGAGSQTLLREGEVTRGTIEETVSATGEIAPRNIVNLSFAQAGEVSAILVAAGEAVSEGEALATLDTERLQIAVQQAESAVQMQELLLERLTAPPSDAQIAQAQAGVSTAWANYNRVAEGADPEQVQIAQLEYEQAWQTYLDTDAEWRATPRQFYPGDVLLQFEAGVHQAATAAEIARLQLEQARADPDTYALQAAWAQVAQAQAQLDGLLAGPTEDEVRQAEIGVEQAQIGLERAQEDLEGATLRAPSDGVVAEVNLHIGELPPPTTPAIVFIDNGLFHINVEVDEIDVVLVALEQPVRIMLDALPNTVLTGTVTDIAPAASASAGVVTYTVQIELDPTDAPLRSGLTATADIVVERAEDVLVVPNWAIRYDRESGQAFASVLTERGDLEEVPVTLGLRGDTQSQVLDGLEEGDHVAVSLARESFGPFGGE